MIEGACDRFTCSMDVNTIFVTSALGGLVTLIGVLLMFILAGFRSEMRTLRSEMGTGFAEMWTDIGELKVSVAGIDATQEAHGRQLGELTVSVARIEATQEAHGKQLDRMADPGERAPLSTAS